MAGYQEAIARTTIAKRVEDLRTINLIKNGALPSGYAADDGVGLHFVGTRLAQIVSSRVNARAYEVRLNGLELIETELLPKYLGR